MQITYTVISNNGWCKPRYTLLLWARRQTEYLRKTSRGCISICFTLSLSLTLSPSFWTVKFHTRPSDWIPNMTGSNLFDQIKHVVNIYVRPGSPHPASWIQYWKQQGMCQPLDIFEIFLQNKSRKKKTLCPEAGAALLTRDNYYDWSVQSDGAAWCINISRVPSPV